MVDVQVCSAAEPASFDAALWMTFLFLAYLVASLVLSFYTVNSKLRDAQKRPGLGG